MTQIFVAIERIERRFAPIESPDDFLDTEEGIDKLDAIFMILVATGESLKNIDKVTVTNHSYAVISRIQEYFKVIYYRVKWGQTRMAHA
ncbi:MAG: hypothetical protein L3J70_10290 [Gammaproteobacteria bacterium]|nr:hypothetical protein [Gammaproteobacteria bacterium]